MHTLYVMLLNSMRHVSALIEVYNPLQLLHK